MDISGVVFVIAIIVMSAVVHEVMHGVAANSLGDPTARLQGRLTLNPIAHLDPFGSVLLPLIFALTNSPILFGWAKPVPYNPYNLRPGRFSEAIVAIAGPASNLVIALIASLIIRIGITPTLQEPLFMVVLINIMMAIFNMMPIPPLDGSKVLSALLPRGLAYGYDRFRASLEFNPFMGFGVVLVVILLLGGAFSSFIWGVSRALAGV